VHDYNELCLRLKVPRIRLIKPPRSRIYIHESKPGSISSDLISTTYYTRKVPVVLRRLDPAQDDHARFG
jgi:hypothetical protein